jgi:RNA polymerase sigma-70 factor (ECF subfamily)
LDGLESLVREYYFPAVHTAYLIVRDKPQAEDVVQTVFLDLPQKIKRYDEQFAFRPWFLKCIVNASLNALKGRDRFVALDEPSADGETGLAAFPDPQPFPEEQAISAETRRAVWESLGKLNPQQRAVIVMRYYLQFNESEIVQQMNRPRSSVKWWLHTAKARLRRLLYTFAPPHTTPNDPAAVPGGVHKETDHEQTAD